jgi:4-carboxymuconolactone decarboxylase
VLRHLVSGDLSDELTEGEQLAQRVARQLCVGHRVADELYREAETAFGTKGLIDMDRSRR